MSIKLSIAMNMTGIFILKEPFHADANYEYRVEAIRTFDEIRGLGKDPFFEYYNKLGVERSTYQRDVDNNEVIITLMSEHTDPVFVPSSFVESLPIKDYVPYSHLILGISLGLLPDTFDTTQVEDIVKNIVAEYTGITADVRVVKNPTSGIVTPAQDQHLRIVRNAAIKQRNTIYSRWLAATEELAKAKEHIAALEQYLINNQ